MTEPGKIAEIIATYQIHGWVLRRVLLSSPTKIASRELIAGLAAGVTVTDSDMDAAWFSRPFGAGSVPWEIRYLGEPAYALLEDLDVNSPDFELALHEAEARLRNTVTGRKSP